MGLSEKGKEFSSLDKVHDHVEILRVLECSPKIDEEGVFDDLKHGSFVVCVFDLLHFYDLLFLEDFDCIESGIVTGLHEVDSAKASCSEGSLDGKVDDCILSLCCADGVLLGREESGGDDTVVVAGDRGEEARGRSDHGVGSSVGILLIRLLWLWML